MPAISGRCAAPADWDYWRRSGAPKSTPPRPDLVALAVTDLRRRLTKEERQALVRRLQDEDQ
jgi:hypothetical protein